MVSECCGDPPHIYCVDRPVYVSEEHASLAQFVCGLNSSNCTSEPGIAETRKEAKLLMMLGNVPTENDNSIPPVPVCGSVSSSSAEFASDSSDLSFSSKREVFSFTCPSLSLENPYEVESSSIPRINSISKDVSNSLGNNFTSLPFPAELLGRPLTIEDRDALRLSADAMARNILHTFEKGIDWRIDSWKEILSNQLIEKECNMVHQGARTEELKVLLNAPEALLFTALRTIAEDKKITVQSSNTAFEVLPRCISKADKKGVDGDSSPAKSRSKHKNFEAATDTNANSDGDNAKKEELDHHYKAEHALHFRCTLYMDSPAGPTEIALVVPGTIEGTFSNNESDPSLDLQSVCISLNTKILSAIIDKASREMVRSSIECIMPPIDMIQKEQEKAALILLKSPAKISTQTPFISSPSPAATSGPSAAFVTPRDRFSEAPVRPTSKVLLPIPDDLDDKNDKPRRISPLFSPSNYHTPPEGSPKFGPCILKRRSPVTSEPPSSKRRPPLISPMADDSNTTYHEVAENGPSLPMLVEVACRAMRVD